MTWNLLKESEKKYEDFWKSPEYIVKKSGIKVLVWGPPEVGKTHFALTAPEPIHVIDTESLCVPQSLNIRSMIKCSVSNMEQSDKMYVAAVIDCDGLVSIHRTPFLKPEIVISNTSRNARKFLETIREKIGVGTVYLNRPAKGNWNEEWRLSIQGLTAVYQVLGEILPFLIVKRDVAELVYEFCASRLQRYRLPYTSKEKEIADQVKKLNRRGRRT